VVALRLPPANGCDPFGIEEGGARFIQPAVTRTGDPEVALRLPPANGWDPFGIEEGEEFNRDICGRIAHRLCQEIRCILREMF
jgi:hypothetical protein